MTLAWMSLIAVESTSYMSAENTSSWLYPFFHRLTGVDVIHFEVWHHYLRKTGHFIGYFMLSLLMFGAWRNTLRVRWAADWTWRWASLAFLSTLTVALLDEWHQTFLPGRIGTILDVLLDAFAALTAQMVIAFFLRRRAARRDSGMETGRSLISPEKEPRELEHLPK
jgi:VanZ family protein